jgi:demethylspheroidene O-methyltransferase
VQARASAHPGSFLSDPLPGGADLVTLVRVAHDHPDADVKALLRNIHDALPAGGTLLLAEPMAQQADSPAQGDAYFHFYLLAMGSGRLRTAKELGELMQAAGFTGVERVSNPMPLHTEILIGKKPKGLPDKHAKNVINS